MITQLKSELFKQILVTGFILFSLENFQVTAQSDSIWKQQPVFSVSFHADIFYVYDFNRPDGNIRQPYFYNHNRHNELNLNLGIAYFNVSHAKYRSTIALQKGTYSKDNYSQEPEFLKNIFEAHIGIALTKKNNLWFDAGILTSHIGFESAVAHENWTMTRSILAENSPYYFSGAKLTYSPNHKIELTAVYLNGWQRIQRLSGNSLPAFGTQFNFKPKDNINLNWSTFIGTDDPDSTRRMRYFNNFYGQFQMTKKIGFIAGFDIGVQQKQLKSSQYNTWFSPVIMSRIILNNKWTTALRAEYYHDPNGVIIFTGTANNFKTKGYSINFDYKPVPELIFRIEARWLNSTDEVFQTRDAHSKNTFFLGSSLSIRFLEVWKSKHVQEIGN